MNEGVAQPGQTSKEGVGATERVAAPLRPRSCRTYLRKRLAASWPVVVQNLLTNAEKGSVSHINLAVKLVGFDSRPEPKQVRKPREKSFAKQLLEEIDELEKRNIAEFGPL